MASVDECPDVCVFEMEEEEELDPRVEDYLEILNNSSQEINLLESELDRARNQFRNLLGKSTQKLKASYDKLGKCVGKARPYYVLLTESKEAQAKAHNAAVQFQRANSIYQVAKETVGLAEERVTNDGNRKDFDSAWQEMLNHATTRFMESEEEKSRSEEMHMAKAMAYATVKLKLDAIEKDMPKIIAKAKPYFDLKDRLEYAMKQERQNVEDLQRALSLAKQKYKATLKSLETISDSIHEKRKARASSQLPPRTPGVGAESIYSQSSDTSDLPSINLDIISETSSGIYIDDDAVSMGDRASVSRTPSGCSLASRTPGVGTSSCELVNQNGYSPASCLYETSATAALEFNGENDGDAESLKRPRENLSRVSFEVCANGTNGLNAETKVESATAVMDDLDLCPIDDLDPSKLVIDHDPSGQSQNETCVQNPESCEYSTNASQCSPVDKGVDNDCRSSCENSGPVDVATCVDSEVKQLIVPVDVATDGLTNGSTVSHETLNGHDSPVALKDTIPINQLHRHRKLRGAQFPILVGLSNCSRLPAPPLCPAPLAFYPPIPQPPQAVTLAQNSGLQNSHMASDQPLESADQTTDKNSDEVEVFV